MKNITIFLPLLFLTTLSANNFYSIGHVQSIFNNTSNSSSWQQVYRTSPIRDFLCTQDAHCLAVGDHGALFYNENKDSDAASLVPVQPVGLSDTNQLMFKALTFSSTATNPNGIFVLAGSELATGPSKPFIAYSADRVHWQIAKITMPQSTASQSINDVQWNATLNLFVATGEQGLVLRSQDGHTWVNQQVPSTDNLKSVFTTDVGDYVIPTTAVNQPAYLLQSQDGRSWSKQLIPNDTYPTVGLVYDSYKKYYILANSNKQFFETTTLSNPQWVPVSLPLLPTQSPITAFGLYEDQNSPQDSVGYIVGQASGKMFTTVNNLSKWQFVQAQDHSVITKYKFVQGLGDYLFTTNGTYGDAAAGDVEMNNLSSMIHQDNQYIAVGDGDGIIKSSDGIHWQAEPTANIDHDLGGLNLTDITYANNKFYAVGTHYSTSTDSNTGVLLSSVDGNHWTLVKQWPNTSFSALVFHNNTFYLLASDLNMLTSSDGVTWHTQQLGIPQFDDGLFTIAFGANNTAVCTSDNGLVFTSTDSGKTWQQNRANAFVYTSVIWDEHLGKYIATGNANIIAMSLPEDIAKQWTSMSTNTPDNLDFLNVSLLSSMLYINGFSQESMAYNTYQSETGSNWTYANISNNFLQTRQFDVS